MLDMKVWIAIMLLSSTASADLARYYPDPYWKEPNLVELYSVYYGEYAKAQVKNPLLAPPNNLTAGDSGATVAEKVAMSRLDIINNQIKDLAQSQINGMDAVRSATKTINDLSAKVAKVTNQSLELKSSLCDVKSSMNYDMNKSTLTAWSICNAYNAKVTYNNLTNAYEASIFNQLRPTFKLGVKSTSLSNGGLAFVEGSW